MKKFYINALTLVRIIFGILFFYYAVFDFNVINLIIIFILTAISDNLDGKLARRYDLTSLSGAKLDVVCDFGFIFLSTLAVAWIDLIPIWFLIVIVFKLVEFFKTSQRNSLDYDKFGHLVALMFYAFPIVAILINSKTVVWILAIFVTVCAIISSISRIKGVK